MERLLIWSICQSGKIHSIYMMIFRCCSIGWSFCFELSIIPRGSFTNWSKLPRIRLSIELPAEYSLRHDSLPTHHFSFYRRHQQPDRQEPVDGFRVPSRPDHPDTPNRICQGPHSDWARADRSSKHEDLFRETGLGLAFRVSVHRPHQEEGRLLWTVQRPRP